MFNSFSVLHFKYNCLGLSPGQIGLSKYVVGSNQKPFFLIPFRCWMTGNVGNLFFWDMPWFSAVTNRYTKLGNDSLFQTLQSVNLVVELTIIHITVYYSIKIKVVFGMSRWRHVIFALFRVFKVFFYHVTFTLHMVCGIPARRSHHAHFISDTQKDIWLCQLKK